MFLKKWKQLRKKGSENETILKKRKSESSFWPPYCRVLVQKIKKLRLFQYAPTSEPCEYGLRLDNNQYQK